MNRKILALILALVVVAVAIVLAVTLNKDTPDGNVSGGRPAVGEKETTPAPGVEDNVIHTEPVETTEPIETTEPEETEEPTTPATENDYTIPTGPADPDAGLKDPDVDVPEDTEPVETTEPAVTEPAVTEPQQTQPTQPTETVPESELDYETFTAMDPAEQRVYMESFESLDAFFEWYNAAKEAYEREHPAIDVGDGVVDLGGLVG